MITQYVTGINPANDALRFIDLRLSYSNYRGSHSSQQNRYDVNGTVTILRLMVKYLDANGFLAIRTTDCSKRPENTPDEYNYAMFCNDAKREAGIGTQDAMRKNLFVDWHRMGLIKRFNAHGVENDPYTRSTTKYVALSELGYRLINSADMVERQYLFSKALNTLLSGFVEDVMKLLDSSETDQTPLKYLDFDEFMFFVTAMGAEGYGIDINQCKHLILCWRLLTVMNKSAVKNKLKETLIPDLYVGDKNFKRDWHNWVNKNEQMWHLFNQVAFFVIESGTTSRLYSTTSDITGLTFDRSKLKRSNQTKTDYFKNHGILGKTIGFELDHIIPLLEANTVHEFKILDRWENLIYIDALTHARKSQRGSKHKIFNYSPINYNDVALIDHNNDHIYIENNRQGIFNTNHVPIMHQYNSAYLNRVGTY